MRVITIIENKVVGVKNVCDAYELESNDVVSDLGELGQIQQGDGSFITPEPTHVTIGPTIEERFAEVNANQLVLMDVLATMFEAMLEKGTV
ncbi:hypothetical protein [Desulfosporosinus nitroreducens]|uniref:hypothetical protein n=1 Tax=Desulfosporosinus nitroreducens TaxID=2018668 RepID=UPI00207D6FBC|nr:hypothetical protein [Desulfosporosinus nitroreducens]MCO1603654.1 hypothetical protein [Desulfosporosinus nitroreducens]